MVPFKWRNAHGGGSATLVKFVSNTTHGIRAENPDRLVDMDVRNKGQLLVSDPRCVTPPGKTAARNYDSRSRPACCWRNDASTVNRRTGKSNKGCPRRGDNSRVLNLSVTEDVFLTHPADVIVSPVKLARHGKFPCERWRDKNDNQQCR